MSQHPQEDEDTVLVPCEAAALLKMDVDDLLSLASARAVPGVCLGGQWRFSRTKLLREAAVQAA